MKNGHKACGHFPVEPVKCFACKLAGCPIRGDVLEAEAAAERKFHTMMQIERGARLTGSGKACHRLWVVVDGFIASSTELKDGRRQITSIHTAGDLICPVGGGDGTECWVEALGNSQICEIDLHGLLSGMEANPGLVSNLFRVAHKQLERSVANLVMLGRLDGLERIYLFIAQVTGRLGQKTTGGYRVQLPMSREEIADYLGLNAETVSRLLGRVRKSRLVTFISPTEFIVHDLQSIAERMPTAGADEHRPMPLIDRLETNTSPCRPGLSGHT